VIGLTDRQAAVLAFIRDHLAEHAVPPTIREIMDRFDFKSTNAANTYLCVLEKKGVILRGAKGKARSIRVLGEGVVATPHSVPVPSLTVIDVEVAGTSVYVNGQLVARFVNPDSAAGLARNLRAALRKAAA
jgi:SOS-response transcriptional repressor LexA